MGSALEGEIFSVSGHSIYAVLMMIVPLARYVVRNSVATSAVLLFQKEQVESNIPMTRTA